MQRVIELARVSRERRSIGLKTPLKTLVVIHHDSQYLKDVRSLETYITEELNIRDLVLSSDEASYNVQLSVTADWPILGKKLRKDMIRVKKALPKLSSDQVQGYLQTGQILVDGILLEAGDLVVRRGLSEDVTSRSLEINSDDEVLTILDSEIYAELAQEGLAREVINRVQRLRKKAGLQATDDVKMEYQILSDPDDIGLAQALTSQSSTIEKTLRRPLELAQTGTEKTQLIAEEEQEVQQATFLLRLLKV
jgi:isoleucyl-tRNA synthetase